MVDGKRVSVVDEPPAVAQAKAVALKNGLIEKAAVMKSLGVDDAHAMARGGWRTEATYKQTYAYVFDGKAKSADDEINGFFDELRKDREKAKEV